MDFLKRAEEFCETRGDEYWFKHIYSGYREFNTVVDSVWHTLVYLYNEKTANDLESIFKNT